MNYEQVAQYPYTIERVPLELIHIDHSYQRQPTKPRIKRMAENWCPPLANLVILNKRENGYYYCIDGQHTMNAARLVSQKRGEIDATIEAKVFDCLPLEAEAWIFTHLQQDRKNLTPLEKYKPNIVIKDKQAEAIQSVLDELNLSIGKKKDTLEEGPIFVSAITELNAIFKSHGIDVLRDALMVARDAFDGKKADKSKNNFKQQYLRALALFVANEIERDDYSVDRLVAALREHDSFDQFRVNISKWVSGDPDQEFNGEYSAFFYYGIRKAYFGGVMV